jgi:Fur family ferric uptake transcriptional regulator
MSVSSVVCSLFRQIRFEQTQLPKAAGLTDVDLRRGERSTRQKQALVAILNEAFPFRSTQELLAERGERVGLTAADRPLRALNAEIGVVRSVEGKVLYRRCAIANHHRLACVRWDRTEITADGVALWANRAEYEHYSWDVHLTFEIVRTCAGCAHET